MRECIAELQGRARNIGMHQQVDLRQVAPGVSAVVSAVKSQMEVLSRQGERVRASDRPYKIAAGDRRYRKLAEMYWALALGERPDTVQSSKMIAKTTPP
jgi:hypothetical protein